MLFVIPWGRHWIIGTTDTDWELDKAHPAASRDRHRLRARARQPRARRSRSTHEDVEGVYAGLRPLLSGESEATSPALARARRRRAGARAGRRRGRQVHDLPRDGARRGRRRARGLERARRRRRHRHASRCSAPRATARCEPARRGSPRDRACTSARIEHLLDRYGSLHRRAARADRRATRRSPSRCPAPTTTSRSRSLYAATHEGALHLDDVLARRTRISIETFDRGVEAAERGRAR